MFQVAKLPTSIICFLFLVLPCFTSHVYVRLYEVFIHLTGDLMLRLAFNFSYFLTSFIQPYFFTAGITILLISRRMMNFQFSVFSLSPTITYFLCSSSLLESSSLILEGPTPRKVVLICSVSACSWHNHSFSSTASHCWYLISCLMLTWELVSHWSTWTNDQTKPRKSKTQRTKQHGERL